MYSALMTTLTVTLPDIPSHKVREHAKREGFRSPEAWMQFLLTQHLILEESPRMKGREIIARMQKTGRYSKSFLRELQK
jgi:hypothetical protein